MIAQHLSKISLPSFITRIVFAFTALSALVPLQQCLAFTEDVGAIAILSPAGDNTYLDPVQVTVRVQNFSVNSINTNGFSTQYRIDGGPWLNAPATFAAMAPGATADISFDATIQLANLSIPGSHVIDARTILGNDGNASNDLTSVTINTIPLSSSTVEISELPYFQGFESGAADWTVFDVANSTAFFLGVPNGNLINAAASGANAWKVGQTASIRVGTRTQVISPIFDLESIPLVDISLSVFWESPITDGARLQASSDDGETWTTVGAAGDPANWYNTASVQGLDFVGVGPGWSGYRTAGTGSGYFNRYSTAGEPGEGGYATAGSVGSDHWLTAKNTVVGGAKTKFRVVYASRINTLRDLELGSNINEDGFAFDNFAISEAATASRTISLFTDNDGDGRAEPGDVLSISTVVANQSTLRTLTAVGFIDLLADSNLSLVVGSVTTTAGSVTTGNTSGNTTVDVNIGTQSPGTSVTITYRATVGALNSVVNEVCAQGTITAAQFTTVDLLTDDPNTEARADTSCVAAFIDADSDGLQDGGDPDGDGLTNAAELRLGTDPFDDDTDGDGVIDGDEVDVGTDPLESSSFQQSFGTGLCTEWNGFLKAQGFTQILEQRNSSGTPISVRTTLYNIDGVAQSNTVLNLAPGQQRDLILNNVTGYTDNTYGLICSEIISGPADSIDGQLVNYLFANGSYSLAFIDAFIAGRTGSQFVNYNTFQPSLNAAEANDFVAGWIEVSLDSLPSSMSGPSSGSGTLMFYSVDGTLVRTQAVTVNRGERRDVDVHSVGANKIGLVSWVPSNPTTPFRIRQKRYYTTAPAGQASTFRAVASIPATAGSGSLRGAPIDITGKTAVVEVSNVLNSAITVTVSASPTNGNPNTQLSFPLPARSTRHVIVNGIVSTGLVNVRVDSDTESSVVAQVLVYGRTASLGLGFTDAVTLSEGSGLTTRSSYNSFLNQDCRLLVANRTSSGKTGTVTMTRFDGTVLLNAQPVAVAGNGVTTIDLCGAETQQAYGSVVLTPQTPGTLLGVVFRRNSEGTVEFSVPSR